MMKLLYNGVDIYANVSVVSCVHEMVAEERSDRLTVRLGDTAGLWNDWNPVRGDEIAVEEGAARTGRMYVRSVEPSNGLLTLRALSMPLSCEVAKSRSWEGVHFLQLCRQIAGEHGLKFAAYGVGDQVYDYLSQSNQTDVEFLQSRCLLESCAMLIYDGTLVVYDEAWMEGQTPAAIVEVTSDGVYKYADNSAATFGGAVVAAGDFVGECVASDGVASRVLRPRNAAQWGITSDGEALRFAQGMLRYVNKYSYAGWFEENLLVEYAAASTVTLRTDRRNRWDGPVFLTRVRHDLVAKKSRVWFRCPLSETLAGKRGSVPQGVPGDVVTVDCSLGGGMYTPPDRLKLLEAVLKTQIERFAGDLSTHDEALTGLKKVTAKLDDAGDFVGDVRGSVGGVNVGSVTSGAAAGRQSYDALAAGKDVHGHSLRNDQLTKANVKATGLAASDVGARPSTWTPTAVEVGARPSSWMPTATQVGADPAGSAVAAEKRAKDASRPVDWVPTAVQVGARPSDWMPSAGEVGADPAGSAAEAEQRAKDASRPVDWVPTAVQVGARPDNWTPTAAQVGADPAGSAAEAEQRAKDASRPVDWVPTAVQVGARPDNWTPTAAQVGADPAGSAVAAEKRAKDASRPVDWVPTASQVGARPSSWTPSAGEVGADPVGSAVAAEKRAKEASRPVTWTPSASEVGARPSSWMPSASEVGADPVGSAAAAEANAKEASRPVTWTPTASQVGARPDSWMPTAGDVGADPVGSAVAAEKRAKEASRSVTWTPSASEVGARPSSWMPSASEVGADPVGSAAEAEQRAKDASRPVDWVPTAVQVGARPDNWMPSAGEVGADPAGSAATAEANAKDASRPATWTPSASDVGARPSSWTPSAGEVGADPVGSAVAAEKRAKEASRPVTWTPSASEVGARPSSWMPSASEVGADPAGSAVAAEKRAKDASRPVSWMPSASEVGADPVGSAVAAEQRAKEASRPVDWTPSASDVGARPSNWMPSASEVGADPVGSAVAAEQRAKDASRPVDWVPTAVQVGARPSNWMPSASEVGADPAGSAATAEQRAKSEITARGLTDAGNFIGKINGVHANKTIQSTYRTIATSGWYRLATNGGNRAHARFLVQDRISGRQGAVEFLLGAFYNAPARASFSLLSAGRYNAQAIRKVRLLTKTTYNMMYVDVYCDTNREGTISLQVLDNHQSLGWAIADGLPCAAIPDGYNVREWTTNLDDVAQPNNQLTKANVKATGLAAVDVGADPAGSAVAAEQRAKEASRPVDWTPNWNTGEVLNKPENLAELDASASTKLSGIKNGADVTPSNAVLLVDGQTRQKSGASAPINAALVNGKSVAVSVPAGAKFTDTLPTVSNIPPLPAAKITSGQFGDNRIESAGAWHGKPDDWGGLPGRPVELTDGRIGQAIDSQGRAYKALYSLNGCDTEQLGGKPPSYYARCADMGYPIAFASAGVEETIDDKMGWTTIATGWVFRPSVEMQVLEIGFVFVSSGGDQVRIRVTDLEDPMAPAAYTEDLKDAPSPQFQSVTTSLKDLFGHAYVSALKVTVEACSKSLLTIRFMGGMCRR